MRRIILLLLPALIPSWRFFKTVAPSPRLQFRLRVQDEWLPVCPRPDRVGPRRMIRRLLWNPSWNEQLYLVTLSERLVEHPTPRTETEIRTRVGRLAGTNGPDFVQFRLIFVFREGAQILEEELFLSSPPCSLGPQ